MALTTRKDEPIHSKSGSALAAIKASFDNGEHTELADFGPEAAIIYQIQKMQDEITYLRTEISDNKDKTGVTSGQASAITANTAKVSLAGGSATTLYFGEMITVPSKVKGGSPTYHIIMTATKSGVAKTVTLILT